MSLRAPLLYLVLVLAIAGCAQIPVLYVPPAIHAPMFDRDGEAEGSIHLGMNGVDVRGSWTAIDHLGVAVAGSWKRSADSSEHASHSYGEVGVGAYTLLVPTIHGEAWIGAGYGTALGYGRDPYWGQRSPAWAVSGTYQRYFAQLLLGYKPETVKSTLGTSYAIVMRIAHVRFPTILDRGITTGGSGWFLEPAFVARYGSRAVQVETQIGAATRQSGSGFETDEYFTSIGLHFALHEIF